MKNWKKCIICSISVSCVEIKAQGVYKKRPRRTPIAALFWSQLEFWIWSLVARIIIQNAEKYLKGEFSMASHVFPKHNLKESVLKLLFWPAFPFLLLQLKRKSREVKLCEYYPSIHSLLSSLFLFLFVCLVFKDINIRNKSEPKCLPQQICATISALPHLLLERMLKDLLQPR